MNLMLAGIVIILLGLFLFAGAVTLWITLGIEWTVRSFRRPISLRELFALVSYWAVTFAAVAALLR